MMFFTIGVLGQKASNCKMHHIYSETKAYNCKKTIQWKSKIAFVLIVSFAYN